MIHTWGIVGPSSTTAASEDPHHPDGEVHERQHSRKPPAARVESQRPTIRSWSKLKSLVIHAPAVAENYDENHGTPDDYTAGRGYKATWKCPTCGESWTASILSRVSLHSGCPRCFALRFGRKADGTRTSHPTLKADGQNQHPVMLEWDSDANEREGFFPDKIKLRSRKRVKWVCRQCSMGHLYRFKASAYHCTALITGCSYCTGKKVCECNSLQAWFPRVAEQWDYDKNKGTPADYTSGSHAVVWWKSAEQGSWQQTINSRAHT